LAEPRSAQHVQGVRISEMALKEENLFTPAENIEFHHEEESEEQSLNGQI